MHLLITGGTGVLARALLPLARDPRGPRRRASTCSRRLRSSIPPRPVDEETPIGEVAPMLRSALAAAQNALGFTGEGRRGVTLRLGLLDGPARATTSRSRASAPRSTSPMPPRRCSPH
jgi:hypothetical protein